MDTKLIAASQTFALHYLRDHLDTRCTYHNLQHTKNVIRSANLLAKDAALDENDHENLVIAATLHDIGYCHGAANHENKSAEIAANFLSSQSLDENRIKDIQELIRATKLDWKGENYLAMLLRDADLNNLADKNYLSIAENLRKEKINFLEKEISEVEWLDENLNFFAQHKYQSKEGKKRYNKGKKKNNKKLLALLQKNEDMQTIASNKSAQTQLKTALRNHIDLSAIADNKANIMLSVNAVVITVGLPLLLDRLSVNPKLLIPTIILATSSVISIVFATLATRPIRMSGNTDPLLIPQKKSNLFFFGNFYKMKFDDYENGIKQVVGNSEILDNSITRDLFFLGASLGKKYDFLRLCYNIFMVGIVLAVLSFVVVLAVSVI